MKGKKTVAFNILALLLLFLQSSELAVLLPQGSETYIAMAVTLINLALRFVTTGPVFSKT